MALISCKECGNQVSDQAPTCPKCGTPIAAAQQNITIVQAPPPKKGLGCGGIIGIIIVIIIIAAAVGGKAKKEESEKNISAAPALTINAKELIDAYKANEVAADQQYKGKIVQVTGVSDRIGKVLGSSYVTVGTGAQFEIPQIQCSVDEKEEARLASLKQNTKITVKGKVTGLSLNISLDDCVVVP